MVVAGGGGDGTHLGDRFVEDDVLVGDEDLGEEAELRRAFDRHQVLEAADERAEHGDEEHSAVQVEQLAARLRAGVAEPAEAHPVLLQLGERGDLQRRRAVAAQEGGAALVAVAPPKRAPVGPHRRDPLQDAVVPQDLALEAAAPEGLAAERAPLVRIAVAEVRLEADDDVEERVPREEHHPWQRALLERAHHRLRDVGERAAERLVGAARLLRLLLLLLRAEPRPRPLLLRGELRARRADVDGARDRAVERREEDGHQPLREEGEEAGQRADGVRDDADVPEPRPHLHRREAERPVLEEEEEHA